MAKDKQNTDDVVAEVAERATTRTATFADLASKPRRSLTFPVTIGNDDDSRTVLVKYRALDPKEYDELVAAHPPQPKDRREGAIFNLDTFAPALISAVALEPRLSYEQAVEIWTSPDWSSGELTSLFLNAQHVCNSGLDVPFNARG